MFYVKKTIQQTAYFTLKWFLPFESLEFGLLLSRESAGDGRTQYHPSSSQGEPWAGWHHSHAPHGTSYWHHPGDDTKFKCLNCCRDSWRRGEVGNLYNFMCLPKGCLWVSEGKVCLIQSGHFWVTWCCKNTRFFLWSNTPNHYVQENYSGKKDVPHRPV